MRGLWRNTERPIGQEDALTLAAAAATGTEVGAADGKNLDAEATASVTSGAEIFHVRSSFLE